MKRYKAHHYATDITDAQFDAIFNKPNTCAKVLSPGVDNGLRCTQGRNHLGGCTAPGPRLLAAMFKVSVRN